MERKMSARNASKTMTTGQFLQPYLANVAPFLYWNSYWWTALGFAGNILVSSRFFVQWLASERKQELVVPASFWHLSFWGSVINLLYVIHLDSAPLILGVAALPVIYGRNLVLLRRKQARMEAASRPAEDARQPRLPLYEKKADALA